MQPQPHEEMEKRRSLDTCLNLGHHDYHTCLNEKKPDSTQLSPKTPGSVSQKMMYSYQKQTAYIYLSAIS